MCNGQVFDFVDLLNGDFEVGVEDGQFWTTGEELDELVELLLVVGLENFPQPLYYHRRLSVALRVFHMRPNHVNYINLNLLSHTYCPFRCCIN